MRKAVATLRRGLEMTGRVALVWLGGGVFVGAIYLMARGALLLLHGGC